MKKMKFSGLLVLMLVTAYASLVEAGNASGDQFALPRYSSSDKFGVNIMALQVNTSLETVAIGDALGLSHSISTYENDFITQAGFRGTNDKFGGRALASLAAKANVSPCVSNLVNNCPYDYYIMTVQDDTGSAQFQIGDINNTFLSHLTSFVPLRDSRQKLEVHPTELGKLVWTQPDGKKVTFFRSPDNSTVPLSTARGYLEKIEYPNGYTISIEYSPGYGQVISVSTNTGYQLKYNYFVRDASGDASIRPDLTSQTIPRADTTAWDGHNLWSVVAINNALERCDSSNMTICVGVQDVCPAPLLNGKTCTILTKKWPTATFNWPLGMPRTAFDPSKETIFKVTNSKKQTTEYYLKGVDIDVNTSGQSYTSETDPLKHSYLPRLIGIKPAGSSLRTINYSYTSAFQNPCPDCQFYDYLVPLYQGRLTTAWGIPGSAGYYSPSNSNNPYQMTVNSVDTIVKLRSDLMGGVADSNGGPGIQHLDGKLYFDGLNISNRLTRSEPNNGPSKSFGYDARGNVDTVIINDTDTTKALYPTNCTNSKTCNQPIWTKDAKGNQTDYTYHAASGQVETVTLPANKNGVRAKTRYGYTPLSATYFTASGSTTGTPIELKTSEKTCINTATVGDACAGNGSVTAEQDEVITRYEYNTSRNLVLQGMTVTAADATGAIVTKRICYQYDIYGNRIGETQPKLNPSSCPQ